MARSSKPDSGTAEVEAFLGGLQHALKPVLVEIRAVVLASDPRIEEGIKWNTTSFYYKDYFATATLRNKDFAHLVLHTGAKVRNGGQAMPILDPGGILKWLGKDRAGITFNSVDEVKRKSAALTSIIRQWVQHMNKFPDLNTR